jgi:hypothetical protein
VLKIAGDEFQQSVAVARLAVKLCELEHGTTDPKRFLDKAYELIACARERVLRPQTDLEYLAEQGGDKEALVEVFKRRSETVPFKTLCDPKREQVVTKTSNGIEYKVYQPSTKSIQGIEWKVYRSERGFDDLFLKYWSDIGEKWKEADRTKKPIPLHSEDHRTIYAALARKDQVWKERGERLLRSWKQYGVPPADFLALAEFRRAHDKRAANLKKPKKRRVAKSRTRRRNVRARARKR